MKTWRRCLSLGARRSSSDKCSCDSLAKSKSWSCTTTSSSGKEKTRSQIAPEGCFSVYVGPEKQRFVVKTEFANHPLFKLLLEDAETEYGFSRGPILLPCEVELFYRVLAEMESGGDKNNIDSADFRYGKVYSPLQLFSPSRNRNLNANKGYGAYRLLSPSRMLKVNGY